VPRQSGNGWKVRATNPVEERVIALVEPTASGLGFRIVRVRVSGNRRKRLQIMAERVSDGEMSVEDCGRLSRALSPVFDLEDPIPGEYDLEVSSPGIDRPLVRIEDFARFKGHVAKLETAGLHNGQRRFRGEIAAIDGDAVVLVTEQGEIRLNFSALSDARLVLTDKLIEQDLKRAKAAQAAEQMANDEGKTS
jgi:ribosome maturation factor RimP